MLRSVVSLYSFSLARSLIVKLEAVGYSPFQLLNWFWHAKDFRLADKKLNDIEWSFSVLLMLGMLAQIGTGIGFLVEWARHGTAGSWQFGVALLLSYPLVWAHVVVIIAAIGQLGYFVTHPKKSGRSLVCSILDWQVKRLRQRHDFSVVAVAGSVGKTSTKTAIAQLLGQTLRVRWQEGNYNDRVTVPLVLFGHDEPNILNVAAWLRIFRANAKIIASDYAYDVVVVELGTDGPGQMKDFAYVRPDISVITAVSPEHMEYFKTLDAVASEELTVFDYSETVLVNGDDIAGSYLAGRIFQEYSLVSRQADYFASSKPDGLHGQDLSMKLAGDTLNAKVQYVGKQGAKFALAAAAVADMLKVNKTDIAKGLPKLSHFAGRLQILPGTKGSTLIDDTYNASPLAAKAALDVLYAAKTTQRIAILGSMNELGKYSQEAHEEVGAYCDPKKLALVVAIGKDAETWLAPAATEAGCQVVSFASPYDAGEYVNEQLKKGAVVLAKGSQNGVFAEEALKPLLTRKSDAKKLVRQSKYWLGRKATQFPR